MGRGQFKEQWEFFYLLLDLSRCVFTKYSNSKFSQNTTNLLPIKVATCLDSRSHHQANYWTMFEAHQVKGHIWDPKVFTAVRECGYKWDWYLQYYQYYNITIVRERGYKSGWYLQYYNSERMWIQMRFIFTRLSTSIAPTFSHCCKHFGIPKIALSLDEPQTWFNNWPDDDSSSRNMSPLQPFKPRIKSHLLFAGIIRSSPFSPR